MSCQFVPSSVFYTPMNQEAGGRQDRNWKAWFLTVSVGLFPALWNLSLANWLQYFEMIKSGRSHLVADTLCVLSKST